MAKDPNPFRFYDGDAPSDDEPKNTRQPIKAALTQKESEAVATILSGPILNEATGATEVGADALSVVLEKCFALIDVAGNYDVDPEKILAKIEGMPRKQRAQLLASF